MALTTSGRNIFWKNLYGFLAQATLLECDICDLICIIDVCVSPPLLKLSHLNDFVTKNPNHFSSAPEDFLKKRREEKKVAVAILGRVKVGTLFFQGEWTDWQSDVAKLISSLISPDLSLSPQEKWEKYLVTARDVLQHKEDSYIEVQWGDVQWDLSK